MQHTQFLVVGLGIAGTLISYELWKAGKNFIVVDNPSGPPKASVVAGAVINPVNINKWDPVTNADIFIPQAIDTYRGIGKLLGFDLVEETAMLLFQLQATHHLFIQKCKEGNPWLKLPAQSEIALAGDLFQNVDALGVVKPVWKIHAAILIEQWRDFLRRSQMFIEEQFKPDETFITTGSVRFKNIIADKIIFCEGAAASQNPFFRSLPFTRNRGEALLIYIPGLPEQYIYHNNIRLVPAGKNLFWCGSNYQWKFENLSPDPTWRSDATARLKKWLRLPFTVEDHIVAERPTTAGQELFMGIHPAMSSVGILNGFGTKGFSVGPLLAKQLCDQFANPQVVPANTLVKPLTKWLQ